MACYRGLNITGGGAKAVGNAVNETVVYAFMALFAINVVVTAIGIQMTGLIGGNTNGTAQSLSAAGRGGSGGRPTSWAASATTCCSIRALGGVPHATVHFRREIVRLIAEISMGAGTLAMIGGTVVIVGFLTLAAGGTLAVQGYSSLGDIGIEALTGFLAAFINVRISAPVVAGHRAGGHLRRRGDGPAGRDANQRGDRRAGGHGRSVRSSTWSPPGSSRG